jgi:hypothetical protein
MVYMCGTDLESQYQSTCLLDGRTLWY